MRGAHGLAGGRAARISGRRMGEKTKGSTEIRAALVAPHGAALCAKTAYLEDSAVLPNLLRNFSTRPPMLSTDFWVPV